MVFPPHAVLGLGSPPCLYSRASEPGQEKSGRHSTLGVTRNFSVRQGWAPVCEEASTVRDTTASREQGAADTRGVTVAVRQKGEGPQGKPHVVLDKEI